MKNFALIGAAGYIAPRHMEAISVNNGNLIAAIDPNDSVGIIDRYFPKAAFFTEIERFDRHLEKLRISSSSDRVDYISICSPNYLHDAHIRLALRIGADAICEKPLALTPWNLDALSALEKDTGKRVFNILQLREHSDIIKLKSKVEESPQKTKAKIDLAYITRRGRWYDYSWKGVPEKSGGVAANIGVHFFDMLIWVFGKVQSHQLHLKTARKMAGSIELENASVRWFLSVDEEDLPEEAIAAGKPAYRSITIDNEEIEFSGGFTDLHNIVYKSIINGEGYGIADARPSIELVHQINSQDIPANIENPHPLLKKAL